MRLSVIVPVLDESVELDALLDNLNRELGGDEWIFVDGGSRDGTRERLVSDSRVTLVDSDPGRGRQIAAGCDRAGGDVLLVMHADGRLCRGARRAIEAGLSRSGTSLGAFRLTVDHPDGEFRLMERLVAWRCRRFGMPYGDQGFFFTRSSLDRAGGWPSLPLMEDVELVRRMNRIGSVRVSGHPILASARRYEKAGFWRGCTRNVILVLLHLAGVPPETLRRLYG